MIAASAAARLRHRRCDGHEGLRLVDRLALDLVVALGFGHVDEQDRIVEITFELADATQAVFEFCSLAHQLLRQRGIVPQGRVFGFGVQFCEAADRSIDVKDASSAALRTA